MHLARRIGRRRLLLLLAVLVGGLAALAPIPSLSKSRTTMKADSDDVASALHGARSAGPLRSRRTEIPAFHMIGASWKGPITSTPRVIQFSMISFCLAGSGSVGPSKIKSTPSALAAWSAPFLQEMK